MQHIDTIDALSTVIRHELPDELQRCRLDLERARMEAEDLRGAMLLPYGNQFGPSDPRYRSLTWRGAFQERGRRVYNLIGPTQELLGQCLRYIRTHGLGAPLIPLARRRQGVPLAMVPHPSMVEPRVVLTMAYNIMCECERTLNGEADDTDGEHDMNGNNIPKMYCEECDRYNPDGWRYCVICLEASS